MMNRSCGPRIEKDYRNMEASEIYERTMDLVLLLERDRLIISGPYGAVQNYRGCSSAISVSKYVFFEFVRSST